MKYFALLITFLVFLLLSCSPSDSDKNKVANTQDEWWKEEIVYQIYPRSFKDTNGDGIGDLKGIIENLDYIQSLGVTAVWLNPIYSSPNDDNGYDVSDYRNIMKDFGTMKDFDHLLEGLHKRGLKLIMDIVVNHSSDEHKWFKQSRSSRDNPYRDYYHWWPAEKGKPNYRYSLFDVKGDAWKYDKQTNAYYLHYFSQKQPDLNWSNPKLRQEVYDIMKFWAKKGVDGFRLDAFQFAAKDTTFPAFPVGYEKNFIAYYAMQEGIHDYLKEMHNEVFSQFKVMSVAEGAGRNFEDAHNLVDADRKELNMAYAFDGVDLARYEGYELGRFKKVFTQWDSAFADKGWISIFLANHDQARMVSRFASDKAEFREAAAKMLNTFILTMRGTPYCYYGDELGMTNTTFKGIEDFRDIAAINGYKKAKSKHEDMDYFMNKLRFESRDNGRTPMQWNTNDFSGFTKGKPWLPVNANHKFVNVEQQQKDPLSVLQNFKSLTALRKNNAALIHGKYTLLAPDHKQVYAYTRTMDGQKILVLLNFSNTSASITLPEIKKIKQTLINNYTGLSHEKNTITLQAYQATVHAL